jgi:hypothetical protein
MNSLIDACGRAFSFFLLVASANMLLLNGTPAQPVPGDAGLLASEPPRLDAGLSRTSP